MFLIWLFKVLLPVPTSIQVYWGLVSQLWSNFNDVGVCTESQEIQTLVEQDANWTLVDEGGNPAAPPISKIGHSFKLLSPIPRFKNVHLPPPRLFF